jgi:hypothetical protein
MKRNNNKASDKSREKTAPHAEDSREEAKKLPGEYPPGEDIMNRRDSQRVGLDVENFSRAIGHENFIKENEPLVTDRNVIVDEPLLGNVNDIEKPSANDMERPVPKDLIVDGDDMEFAAGNESDVTKEDLEALGPKDLSMDMGEDEALLKNRVWPVDMAGEDLDIPGTEGSGDVQDEAIGPEDEENDFYSLGGDRLEDNMEGK